MDLKSRLVRRLERLENHLAFVVSLHLFVENLIDALIEHRSPTAKQILEDHRAYSFSVKLTIVFNMALVPEGLFKNLRALNSLRNEYAHQIDVDLAKSFATKTFVSPRGGPAFCGVSFEDAFALESVDEGKKALSELREITFGWLHDACATAGVTR